MAGGVDTGGRLYSPLTAVIYLFNLVVGTGVLALPAVLSKGGSRLGIIFLALVAFLSFVAVTFVVEAGAAANAILHIRHQDVEAHKGEAEGSSPSAKHSPGSKHDSGSIFKITRRVELGEMADLFFSPLGKKLFYTTILIYLFGDLTIYATFVPSSLIGFLSSALGPGQLEGGWLNHLLFDVVLGLFALLVLPFCFFDFQKTKPLQITTLAVRNAALFTMIVLFLRRATGAQFESIPKWEFSGLPNLFGGAVYAFMCHHSIPGIITPVSNKSKLTWVIAGSLGLVFLIYLVLFVTAAAAFGNDIQDPITFNFAGTGYGYIGEILLLFPVFTLTTNFPLIAITLRNTLLCLFSPAEEEREAEEEEQALVTAVAEVESEALLFPPVPSPFSHLTRTRVWASIGASVPPIILALAAYHSGINSNELVGYTGSYGGVGVMFIIPACLAIYSRRAVANEVLADNQRPPPKNIHGSPFKSKYWPILLLGWSAIIVMYITYNHLSGGPSSLTPAPAPSPH